MPGQANIARLLFILLTISLTGSRPVARGQPLESAYLVFMPLVSLQRQPEWIGPDGGVIPAVVIDPANPANVYAGAWGAGVFKSSDGGATWSSTSQGLSNLYINALAIDPDNPAVLYAGTYKGQLYKSVDAGQSWFISSAGVQAEAIIYSIIIDPRNTNTLLIATRGASNNNDRPWNGVVYKSTDAGATWSPSLDNLGGAGYQDWVYALAIHPTAPHILYAATHENGPYRSRDQGRTWEPVASGITNFSTRAIAVDPQSATPAVVYTGVWTRTGVFKSIDGGASWGLKNTGLLGAHIYGMAIDPLQPKTIYLATYNMGIMKTTTGANSWFASGLQDSPLGTVIVGPGDSRVLFSGASGDGLFVSRDGGDHWQHSQAGLRASSVTGLVIDPQDATLYAGLHGGGMAKSANGGLTWEAFNTGLADKYIQSVVRHPARRILYALTQDSGLYRCDLSAGAGWVRAAAYFPAGTTSPGVSSPPGSLPPGSLPPGSLPPGANFEPVFGADHPFAGREVLLDPSDALSSALANAAPAAFDERPLKMVFASSNPEVAYIGTARSGVYRSADGGDTWAPAGLSAETVWSLAVALDNPDRLFAAIAREGVLQASLDGGNTWTDILLPGATIYSLALSPATPDSLYAGTANGIYRLTGGAWYPSGLDGAAVTVIAVHPGRPAILYAGTNSGAFRSQDGGSSWIAAPLELAGLTIQSIDFDPMDPSVIYFGTQTHGLLRVKDGVKGDE